MKTIVILIGIAVVIMIVTLWVSGIDYMKKNHPDYKGEDLFGEEEKEIHLEDVFNEKKKEELKNFISEHKKDIENDEDK